MALGGKMVFWRVNGQPMLPHFLKSIPEWDHSRQTVHSVLCEKTKVVHASGVPVDYHDLD